MFIPAYRKTYEQGHISERVAALREKLTSCTLCPRRCGVNRNEDEKGFCRTGRHAVVSSHGPHFGEERPLVGTGGSGTIFFTHCNLLCCFCQNYEISHVGQGNRVTSEDLARMMVALQSQGCHNINFVSPTHVAVQIMEALPFAIEAGLTVPLVYNTGGYDSTETLRLLDGIVDIYMPDYKFTDSMFANDVASAPDYPEVVREAIREMHRQVGDLHVDDTGIATRGLLVRHLVLPDGAAGTEDAMHWIASEISPRTYVNIMSQYRPCGVAHSYRTLSRPITRREFQDALDAARRCGLTRLDERVPLRIVMLD